MITNVRLADKEKFNQLASHPLQSWEWGEFRKKTGIEAVRLGRYENGNIVETAQLTIHPLPFTSWTIGYLPKGGIPGKEMLQELVKIGKQYRCIFIKLEPNVEKDNFGFRISDFGFPIRPSPHPLFTRYTFRLDLTNTEEELLSKMHPKTRYNIKVARKHQVNIQEDNSDEAFQQYLNLLMETTRRQKFFAHDRRYHQLMWETLKWKMEDGRWKMEKRNELTAHLLTANSQHEGKRFTLVAWIVFLFNNVLYYPYGASSVQFKNTMASNLMMWEAIRFGKKHSAKIFDMWGALGPDASEKDPWYGFHRFKLGYGPRLVELAGSFDLIINPFLYRLFNLIHGARKIFLGIKSHLQ